MLKYTEEKIFTQEQVQQLFYQLTGFLEIILNAYEFFNGTYCMGW